MIQLKYSSMAITIKKNKGKHMNYTKHYMLSAVMILLVNAGFQSTEKKEAPGINFFGEIITDNEKDTAENITIGGLYENIPLYGIPAASETSPTTNVTHVRLDDVKTIHHKRGKESIKEFQKRDYVEIEVEFKNGKKQNYLIERGRKLYYEIPFSDPKIPALEKELAFEALDTARIEGHRQKSRTSKKIEPEQKSAAREAVCSQAKINLEELEKEPLQGDSKSKVNKIKEAVNYLCD